MVNHWITHRFWERSHLSTEAQKKVNRREGSSRLDEDVSISLYDYSITQDDSPRMTRWGTITWRWLDEDDSTRVTRRGWLDEGTTRRGRLGEDHTTRQDDSTRLLWVITRIPEVVRVVCEGHLFCELCWRVYFIFFFQSFEMFSLLLITFIANPLFLLL